MRASAAAAVLFCSAALWSQQFTTSFEDALNTTFVGVDAETERNLEKVNELMLRKEYSAAARAVQKIIDRSAGGLVNKRGGYYINTGDFCEELLVKHRKEMFAYYRSIVDAAARDLYKRGDSTSILDAARRYALSSDGYLFLFKAGSILFEKGYFSEALNMYTKGAEYFPERTGAPLLAAGFTCACLCGREREAHEWERKIREYTKPFIIGSVSYDTESFIRSVRKTLRASAKETMTEPEYGPVMLWSLDLTSENYGIIMDDALCYVYSGRENTLSAYSMATSMKIWERSDICYPDFSEVSLFVCGAQNIGIYSRPRDNVFKNLQAGRGGMFSDIRIGSMYIVDKHNGKNMIEITPPCGEGCICVLDTQPLFYRGSLYMGYQTYNREGGTPEIHLMRYDLSARSYTWDSFVCQGIGHNKGRLCMAGDRLFYLTNRGVVTGIERYSGRIRWASRYPKGRDVRGRSPRNRGDAGALAASGGMLYTRPYDSPLLFSFDYTGAVAWSRETSRRRGNMFFSRTGPVLIESSALQVYSRQGKHTKSIPLAPSARVFPSRIMNGYFYVTNSTIVLENIDQPSAERIEFKKRDGIPATVEENRRFLAMAYPDSMDIYISRPLDEYAEHDTQLYHFLSARIAFNKGAWERGEDCIASFFKSAGEAYKYEGYDLVPHARKMVGKARNRRAEHLFADGAFVEAEQWFRKVLEADQDLQDGVKCGIFRRITECNMNTGKWADAVRTAQSIIRKYPSCKVVMDNGVQMNGFGFARNVIAQVVREQGADVYAPWERRAQGLFEGKQYNQVVEQYPNSSVYLPSLLMLSKQYEKRGDIQKAAEWMRKYISGPSDAAQDLTALRSLYLRMGMKGVASELESRTQQHESSGTGIHTPLFNIWSVRFTPKERHGQLELRYLGKDSQGFVYEFGGELEKRGMSRGELLWRAKPDYGWLGIHLLYTPASSGIGIQKVLPDMPAQRYGFRKGDIITHINGKPVRGDKQFIRTIKKIGAGVEVSFEFTRQGETQTKRMRLGTRPDTYLDNEIRHIHVFRDKCLIDRDIDSWIVCRDIHTGKRLWDLRDITVRQIAFLEGTVCASSEAGIHYIDAETGRTVWRSTDLPEVTNIQYGGERYLLVQSILDILYVIDRFSGRILYTMKQPGKARNFPLEKGFISVSSDGRIQYLSYAEGNAAWEHVMPFSPVRLRSIRIFREQGEGVTAVWADYKGGVLLRDGKEPVSLKTAQEKWYAAVNGSAVCAGRGYIVFYAGNREQTVIEMDEVKNTYPDSVKILDGKYALFLYTFPHESRLYIVGLQKKKKIVDVLELDSGRLQIFEHKDSLYVMGPRGVTCYTPLLEQEARDQLTACLADKNVNSGIRGARIALKLESPQKGFTLLKPFLETTGSKGLVVEELLLKLRRQAFLASPFRKEIPADGDAVIEMRSRLQYLSHPVFLLGQKSHPWRGAEDFSGNIKLRYTDEYLIMDITVRDDIHIQSKSTDEIMRNDSVAVGLEVPIQRRGLSALDGEAHISQYIITGFVNGKVSVPRHIKNRLPGIRVSGSRQGERSDYTLSIPWKDLTPKGKKVSYFRMGVNIHDNDGEGIKGEMSWTPASGHGITHRFDSRFNPRYFGDIFLK